MKRNLNYILVVGLIITCLMNVSCGLVSNPFRDNSNIPFNSEVWKKSDAFEKGRVFDDMIKKRVIEGLDKDGLIKFLGEPDKKRVEAGNDVFLYRM